MLDRVDPEPERGAVLADLADNARLQASGPRGGRQGNDDPARGYSNLSDVTGAEP